MAEPLDLRINVSEALPGGSHLETAAWVFLPSEIENPDQATVVVAYPGGSYSRHYYHLKVPGRAGYSLAQHLAGQGLIVVVCDHVGLGDSSEFEPFEALTTDVVVEADQATFEGVLAQLEAGTLAPGVPPIRNPFSIGIGHSLGAFLLTLQQRRHRTFDAVGLFGWSATFGQERADAHGQELTAQLEPLAEQRPSFADPTRIPRDTVHHIFHHPNVPADVIEADDAHATRVYPWNMDLMFEQSKTGAAVEDARMIDVPVFVGLGDHDNIASNPHLEPASYPASTDVTVFVLPEAAHCFNFADRREVFYQRLSDWGLSMARVYRAATRS